MKKLTLIALFALLIIPASTFSNDNVVKDIRTVVRDNKLTSNAFCVNGELFVSSTAESTVIFKGESPDGSDLVLNRQSTTQVEKILNKDGKSVGCPDRAGLDKLAQEAQNEQQKQEKFSF